MRDATLYIPAKGHFPDSLTNLITKLGERSGKRSEAGSDPGLVRKEE